MSIRYRAPAALFLALALLASGCGGDKPRSGREYNVQGVVRQLPEASRPGSDLGIEHERIPHFVGQDGKEIEMESMTMPFPVAPDVSLAGFRVGDPVVLKLRVDWQGSPPYQIVRLEKRSAALPAPGEGGG